MAGGTGGNQSAVLQSHPVEKCSQITRQSRFGAHRLIAARVAEFQRRRVEKSPRQRLLFPAGEPQFSRRAVVRVANDRMAEGRKMNPNLMRVAGARVGSVSAGPA
jgi:hypothetical protein